MAFSTASVQSPRRKPIAEQQTQSGKSLLRGRSGSVMFVDFGRKLETHVPQEADAKDERNKTCTAVGRKRKGSRMLWLVVCRTLATRSTLLAGAIGRECGNEPRGFSERKP